VPSLTRAARYVPLRAGLGAILALGASVVAGYVATRSMALPLVGLVAAAGLLWAILRWNRGVFVALALLSILNGIPGVDFSTLTTPGSFRPSDVAVGALVVACAVWAIDWTPQHAVRPMAAPRAPYVGLAWRWALVFGGWWFFTFVRSTVFDTIPPLQALLFGRDFLYFAILVPLLAAVPWTPTALRGLLVTLLLAGTVFALASILGTTGVFDTSFITHPILTASVSGLTRVYSFMNDLVMLLFVAGIGGALLGRSRLEVTGGRLIALVAGTAFLLQLTRAAYVAVPLALAITTGVWLYRGGATAARMRRTILLGVVLVAVPLGIALITSPAAQTVQANAITSRVQSGITEFQTKSATVGYRLNITHQMFYLLGNQWPIGLGFWHPSARYVTGLPDGTIRNPDVGVLNAVMTMGAIGAILLYLPLLYLVFRLPVGAGSGREGAAPEWLRYGAMAWLLVVAFGSFTLITLFSVEGLTLLAIVLTVAARLFLRDSPQRRLPFGSVDSISA